MNFVPDDIFLHLAVVADRVEHLSDWFTASFMFVAIVHMVLALDTYFGLCQCKPT